MSTELELAIERISARVAERRASGEYPTGFEDSLDRSFRRASGVSSAAVSLDLALEALQNMPPYSVERIEHSSRLPGGTVVHGAAGRLVSRQTTGVLQQVQLHREVMDQAVSALAQLVADRASPPAESPWTPDRIDELLTSLAKLQQLEIRLAAVETRLESNEQAMTGSLED